ncbi:hypothetical protein MMG00_02555 [Ignatzschineria rhizosphaerae]|uniref:Apea-like HEPN domain-containing protein n=1 Tax=Ignatzschineria rhizosphaerae TaxID=2923279 RepID=A0ABY3X4R9_9GAMM|nr:hypothetical protein [Ignatzschineria rhizosphaerae]UNM96756.1 hypothetical protein MMG00_02555 [Ignatzschineria rhizosphaerae]
MTNYTISLSGDEFFKTLGDLGVGSQDPFRKAYEEDLNNLYQHGKPSISSLCRIYLLVFVALCEKLELRKQLESQREEIINFRNAYSHSDLNQLIKARTLFDNNDFHFSEETFLELIDFKKQFLKDKDLSCEYGLFLKVIEQNRLFRIFLPGNEAVIIDRFRILLISLIVIANFEWQTKNFFTSEAELRELSKYNEKGKQDPVTGKRPTISNDVRSAKLFESILKEISHPEFADKNSEILKKCRDVFLLAIKLRNNFAHPKQDESKTIEDTELDQIYKLYGFLNKILYLVKGNIHKKDNMDFIICENGEQAFVLGTGMTIALAPNVLLQFFEL